MKTILLTMLLTASAFGQQRKVTNLELPDGRKLRLEEYTEDVPRQAAPPPVRRVVTTTTEYVTAPAVRRVLVTEAAPPVYREIPVATYREVPVTYAAVPLYSVPVAVVVPRRVKSTPIRDFLFGR